MWKCIVVLINSNFAVVNCDSSNATFVLFRGLAQGMLGVDYFIFISCKYFLLPFCFQS